MYDRIVKKASDIVCSQNQLNDILASVARSARENLGDSLREVILYGSYARGDFEEDSDIDIMVLADITAEECRMYWKRMSDEIDRLSLEHDIVISVHIKDCYTFDKWFSVLPFYQSVRKDGVSVDI